MKKRTLGLVFVAGAALALLGTRLAGRWHDGRAAGEAHLAEADPPAAGADEVAALRERLARVEQAQKAQGQTRGEELVATAREVARVAGQHATQEALQAKVDKYYTRELEAKRFQTYFGELDERRRSEGVDLPCAAKIQAAVRRSLQGGSGALAKLTVPSAECGHTLCRLELQVSDPTAKATALGEFLNHIGHDLPTMSVFVPPDSDRMTAYFARPGSDLPPMQSVEDLVANLP